MPQPEVPGWARSVSDELLQRLRDGEAAAWRKVVEELIGRLVAYASRLARGKSKDVVDDLVQCVFLKMYSKIESFGKPGTGRDLTAWSFRIMHHEWLNEVRRLRAANAAHRIHDDRDEPSSSDPDFEAIVTEARNSLEPIRQRLIDLRFYRELAWELVAKELGLGVDETKRLWHATWEMWKRRIRQLAERRGYGPEGSE